MKRIFDLNKKEVNYAWCFDCVPEENSLLFSFDGDIFESPAISPVFLKPLELLGKEIYNKFRDEF